MTVYANDPIRVKITLDQIWNITHQKGIDSTWYPTPDQPEDEFYCKLVASSINPNSPNQETYKDDLEREISKLNIRQDHIREFKPYTFFNDKKNRTIETILDEKVFGKDNRYDILIDKFDKTIHLLPHGKRFITVEDA
jgi:hypothetical protein